MKYILTLLFIVSLYVNLIFGVAYLNGEPSTAYGRKIDISLGFVLEADGANSDEKDYNLRNMFETFYVHTENDFFSIKYEQAFARLWIVILAFLAIKFIYRRVK